MTDECACGSCCSWREVLDAIDPIIQADLARAYHEKYAPKGGPVGAIPEGWPFLPDTSTHFYDKGGVVPPLRTPRSFGFIKDPSQGRPRYKLVAASDIYYEFVNMRTSGISQEHYMIRRSEFWGRR